MNIKIFHDEKYLEIFGNICLGGRRVPGWGGGWWRWRGWSWCCQWWPLFLVWISTPVTIVIAALTTCYTLQQRYLLSPVSRLAHILRHWCWSSGGCDGSQAPQTTRLSPGLLLVHCSTSDPASANQSGRDWPSSGRFVSILHDWSLSTSLTVHPERGGRTGHQPRLSHSPATGGSQKYYNIINMTWIL